MVLCAYFANNKCQFGSNCKNEHVNVKLAIKNDVDSCIKGNQWPLSCYGPFKDKTCLPNFIEDQSFEEIRALCYEAKLQATFMNLVPQLNQQILDAKNKMNLLYDINPDTLNAIVNLHNMSETAPRNDQAAATNPFSIGTTANENQAPFGNNTNSFSNSIFGANANAVTTSAFGGTSISSNIFGGSTAFSGSNINTSSVFGVQNQGFGVTPAAGPFSQSSGTLPFTLSQIGQPTEQQQQPNATLFGFGQSQINPIFGAPPSFASKPSGIFSQANAALSNQSAGGTNIFGQNQQQRSVFSENSMATPSNIFNIDSSGSNPMFGATPAAPTQGIFSGAEPNQSANIFGNTIANSTPQNVFGAAQPLQMQQPNAANPFTSANTIFGNTTASTHTSNIFGNSSFQSQIPSSVEAVPHQQNISSYGNAFQTPDAIINASIYSKMEDLTEQDFAWFKADNFELGKIPTLSPTKKLCL